MTQRTVYTGDQFRFEVVRPTLLEIRLWSRDSEELIVGTAAQETHLGALGRRQIGGGPALGIMQIECPTTHDLAWSWMRKHRPNVALAIIDLVAPMARVPQLLVTDDRYSVALARVLYLSIPRPIPHVENVVGQASYWKAFFNRDGKGSVADYLANYERFVRPVAVSA